MDLLLLFGAIAAGLLTFVVTQASRSKMEEFIEEHEGTLVSKSEGPVDLNIIGSFNRKYDGPDDYHSDHFYSVTYYDKHDNLREAIVKYDSHSKAYSFYSDKLLKTAGNILKEEAEKEQSFKPVAYNTKEGVVTILQEYDRPNAREKISLNGAPLTDGRYKIGFMSYVIVKRGRVVRITMS
ncbi:MAG: hypothetical protein ACXVP0_11855 [Bacteroidia bacterium]